MTTPVSLPDVGVIVLLGASGSGKTTLARTWPADQRLELDAYRELVSGDAGDQEATDDAVFVLHTVLEARLARAKNCVVDATNTRADVRRRLVDAAHAYDLPAVALVMTTPLATCLARNACRPDNRRVPDDTVRRQYEQIAAVRPALHNEDFDQVVTADRLTRLRPLLQQVADRRQADRHLDAEQTERARRVLANRFFGPDIAAAFEWRQLRPNHDPIGTIAVGGDELVLAYRTDRPDPLEWGFEARVPCTGACPGPAWLSVWSPADLLTVHDGSFDQAAAWCAHCGAGTGLKEAV